MEPFWKTAFQYRARPSGRIALKGRGFIKGMSVMMLAAGTGLAAPSVWADQVGQQLNPGVRLGDVVLVRRVEPMPMRVVDKHSGPITSRVNARDRGLEARSQVQGATVIALTDERAAGIRGSVTRAVSAGVGQGMDGVRASGGSGDLSHIGAMGRSLGGSGGGIAGQVTSATGGISDTIGGAMAPLSNLGGK
ncbi:hypothetical protein OM427_08630 [Halomonas sp. 18H]|uniref:hypothetical protein n=1 Tax=Halomonas almeriensis TaxID=308163 RepID=UPI00222E4053|nr:MULTISPECIES: hypothetical protein [Halomonas]MCW4149593.1 hypothetical protein [Halomonas sp. 18H]MDN3553461.1 hypothetical protein [Halomonas almeriensis]